MRVNILFLSLISSCLGAAINSNCGPSDIVFLIDSSGSVGSSNFQHEKDFMFQMSNTFDIGEHKDHVGVVTFSSNPHLEIRLGDFNTKHSLGSAIQKIPYRSGGTHTDLALNYAMNHMFVASAGARSHAHKMLIVLTDGQSNNKAQTIAAAAKVHSHHIKTYVVGIGSHVDQHELSSIATDQNHLFSVGNFQQLQTIPTKLKQEACGVSLGPSPAPASTVPTSTVPTSPITFSPSNCGAADIMFLLDASGSVGSANFHKELQFVAAFATHLPIGLHDVQIGTTTFSTTTHPQFNLNVHHDKTSLVNAIMKIPYQSGNTHTADALEYVAHHNFIPAAGDRPDAPNILVVVTDGRSNNKLQTANAANDIHRLGIKTFAIGVGNGVSSSELSSIATDSKHKFTISTYASLSTLQSELHLIACGLSTALPPSSTTLHHHLTTHPHVPSTTAWVVHPVVSENCHDEVPTCLNYGPAICVTYQSWAKLKCAQFCAFCEVKTTTIPVTATTTKAKIPVQISTTTIPVKTTQAPVTVKTTQAPVTVKTTQAPVTVKTTTISTVPIMVKSTPTQVTVKTTQAPVTVKTTQAPTTATTSPFKVVASFPGTGSCPVRSSLLICRPSDNNTGLGCSADSMPRTSTPSTIVLVKPVESDSLSDEIFGRLRQAVIIQRITGS